MPFRPENEEAVAKQLQALVHEHGLAKVLELLAAGIYYEASAQPEFVSKPMSTMATLVAQLSPVTKQMMPTGSKLSI
jgi:hypothetical protein